MSAQEPPRGLPSPSATPQRRDVRETEDHSLDPVDRRLDRFIPEAAAAEPVQSPKEITRIIESEIPSPPTLAEPEMAGFQISVQPDANLPREPSVEVRIGRIEVQAATTIKTPRRAARGANGPRLSLDDYLRRRREG